MGKWKIAPLGLVVTFFAPYTSGVNAAKCLHILLVVSLCYGQLASNVHAVGHFHALEAECIGALIAGNCQDALPEFAGRSYANDAHRGHSHRHHQHDLPLGSSNDSGANSGKNIENDCAIYHALLSLNCVFHSVQSAAVLPYPRSFEPDYFSASLTRFKLEHQRIRAPPAYT